MPARMYLTDCIFCCQRSMENESYSVVCTTISFSYVVGKSTGKNVQVFYLFKKFFILPILLVTTDLSTPRILAISAWVFLSTINIVRSSISALFIDLILRARFSFSRFSIQSYRLRAKYSSSSEQDNLSANLLHNGFSLPLPSFSLSCGRHSRY